MTDLHANRLADAPDGGLEPARSSERHAGYQGRGAGVKEKLLIF
jgi:hypothetical protein